jgi:regulator of protease activity HflC (stomatin/prohibitin superfamily)
MTIPPNKAPYVSPATPEKQQSEAIMYASNEDNSEKGSQYYNVEIGDDDPPEFDSRDPKKEEVQEAAHQDGFGTRLTKSYQDWRNRPRREISPEQLRLRRILIGIAVCVIFFTAIVLLAVSLRKVENTEYGVEYNIHKKELENATKSGGLFIGTPGYRFVKFPSTYITVDLDNRACVSRDGLIVFFSVTFQYQMTADNMFPAVQKYRDYFKWAEVVEQAGISAIHHACSEFQISNFQNKRGEIQSVMEDNLRLKLQGDPENGLEGVFAVAISLQLRNLQLPEAYQAAVADKQSAEEDIALAQNQRRQETTKARTELLTSQEEARKILDTAVNDAEVLLTEAQLEAQETTFAFEKEAETIVDVKAALNLTTNGVLAYLANSLLAEVQGLHITTGEPARLSRSEELEINPT